MPENQPEEERRKSKEQESKEQGTKMVDSHSEESGLRRLSFESFSLAIAAGALMLLVGGLAYFTNQPFLYPALAPMAFLQAEFPFHKYSRFRDTMIGHIVAVVAGLVSVYALSLTNVPRLGPESAEHIPPPRVGAAALAIVLVILFQIMTKVANPPSTSIGLLFALGYFAPRISDVVEIMAGVTLIAVFGVLHRYALSLEHKRRKERGITSTDAIQYSNQGASTKGAHAGYQGTTTESQRREKERQRRKSRIKRQSSERSRRNPSSRQDHPSSDRSHGVG